MPENKTKPTQVSVAAFLKKAASGQQLKDCQELVKLFKELTGKPAKMWGPSIVGFGSYHYVYESGREGRRAAHWLLAAQVEPGAVCHGIVPATRSGGRSPASSSSESAVSTSRRSTISIANC